MWYEEELSNLDRFNERREKQISKKHNRKLVEVTEKFILYCEEINKKKFNS